MEGGKKRSVNNLNGLDYNSATANFMKYNWLLIASIKQCNCNIKYTALYKITAWQYYMKGSSPTKGNNGMDP